MKKNHLYTINPPKMNLIKSIAAINDDLDYLILNYDFRKKVYNFRKTWQLPKKTGLNKKPLLKLGETPCSCITAATPINELPFGWKHKKYWDWHLQHKEGVHNGTFYHDCANLKTDSNLPKESGWLKLLMEVVLFNEVTDSSVPNVSILSDGAIIIEQLRTKLTSARHPYDLEIKNAGDLPHIEVNIYRDISHHEWPAFRREIKTLTSQFPDLFPNRTSIRTLSTIADLKREGYSHREIVGKIYTATRKSYEESSIGQLNNRARALGL